MALKTTLPKMSRPPRRLSGGSTGAAGSYGLSPGRAYANTAVYWEVIPIYGALRARIRALVASANATLDYIVTGPDFDPEQTSVKATVTITDAGTEDDLSFTAKRGGIEGQRISITLVDPSANDATLTVSVAEGTKAIVVSLATDGSGTITSTAAEVKAAIEAHTEANLLVTVGLPDDTGTTGAGVVAAAAQTYLVLAFSAIVGTQYAAPAITQLALTAGTQGATSIDVYGEGYLILKLTGSGNGTVTYIDVSQHCEVE